MKPEISRPTSLDSDSSKQRECTCHVIRRAGPSIFNAADQRLGTLSAAIRLNAENSRSNRGTRSLLRLAAALLATLSLSNPSAAAGGRGRTLAQSHCSICHTIAPDFRSEVADAPPFDVIGRKHGFDPSRVAAAILGPHPRMNFAPAPADADDIAAYIATLPK